MSEGERGSAPIPLRPRRKCPICGKPAARDAYPFCSRRCADIDLNHWLSNRYVIPAAETDETESGSEQD